MKKGKFPYFKNKIPDIDEFIEARCSDPLAHDQASYILDNTGNLPKNLNLLRFEEVQRDFNEYILKNFPDKIWNTKLLHLNKKKNSYLSISDYSKKLIKTRFYRDYDIYEKLTSKRNLL